MNSKLQKYSIIQIITEILSSFNNLLKIKTEEYGYHLIKTKKMDPNKLNYIKFDLKNLENWDLQKNLKFFLADYENIKSLLKRIF